VLPDYIPVDALAKAFKADQGALKVLNPALRPPIWNRSRFVPRGYAMRVPGVLQPPDLAAAWARLPPTQRYVAQRNDGAHRMRRGETLAGVASASGVSVARLVAANGWTGTPTLAKGDVVHIPLPASRAGAESSGAAGAPPAEAAAPPAPAETLSSEAPVAKLPPPPKEPVSEKQSEASGVLPAAAPTGGGDTTDYSVAADDTVIVQAEETLGHYADWSKISVPMLVRLNQLHKNAVVTLGHKVKLDLSRVSAEQFAAARRDYHRQLQDAFFAAHRISGTETYAVRRGESLWTIAQSHNGLPVWLIVEYNPDVDFSEIRPGTNLALPKVEAINRQ
jgi:membrane-bound lytic murein transglycosylase D